MALILVFSVVTNSSKSQPSPLFLDDYLKTEQLGLRRHRPLCNEDREVLNDITEWIPKCHMAKERQDDVYSRQPASA